MSYLLVTNQANGTIVCAHASQAATLLTRITGLLHTRRHSVLDGMLLRPCSAIHTFGMRYPIDVFALDRANRVLAIRRNLAPCRLAFFPWRTHSILECLTPDDQVAVGNQLLFTPIS